jgi:hypothetical protein
MNLGAEFIKIFNLGNGVPVSKTEAVECTG